MASEILCWEEMTQRLEIQLSKVGNIGEGTESQYNNMWSEVSRV